MGVLSINHPDIQEFIQLKEEEGKFENFNLSVGIWSDFWEALNGSGPSPFSLINPRNGEEVDQVNPKQLLEIIAHSAWESADPGVIFFDQINKYNVLEPAKGKIRGTNPCGEQPLYEYESCNLGSINLHNFVEGDQFDWEGYEDTIRKATRFLDNVIDMNNFPIEKIEKATKSTRKIGLGVMGLANLLFEMEIPYSSEEAYSMMDRLGETLTFVAMDESAEMAEKRGSFPYYEESSYTKGEVPVAGYHEDEWSRNWDELISKIKTNGIRNGMHTTIAPTGSISMIGDTSNGIEPEFSLAYEKRVTAGDFYYANDVLESKLKKRNLYSEELLEEIAENYGSLKGLDEIPEDLKETFVTAMDIHYSDHLMAQAVWQKWISASISKTINMPNNATMEDVMRTYLLAHEFSLKGVTVYRDGSKSKQVLNMKGEKAKKRAPQPSDFIKKYLKEEIENPFIKSQVKELIDNNGYREKERPDLSSINTGRKDESGENRSLDECPKCGGKIIHEGGCNKCVECGWSVCSIS